MYAIKVVVRPGEGAHLPRLYCGYNVVVVEEGSEDAGPGSLEDGELPRMSGPDLEG
jgi:hypothetical protein